MACTPPRTTRCGITPRMSAGIGWTPFLPLCIVDLSFRAGGSHCRRPSAGAGLPARLGKTDTIDRGQVLPEGLPAIALVVGNPARAGRAAERQALSCLVHVEAVAVGQVISVLLRQPLTQGLETPT